MPELTFTNIGLIAMSVQGAWPLYTPILLTIIGGVLAARGLIGRRLCLALAAGGALVLTTTIAAAYQEGYAGASAGSWWLVGAALSIFLGLPALGVAVGRLVGGARRDGWVAAYPLGCYGAALGYAALLVLWSLVPAKTQPPTDEALKTQFTTHRDGFEDAVRIVQRDYITATISSSGSSYQPRDRGRSLTDRWSMSRTPEQRARDEDEGRVHRLLVDAKLWGLESREGRVTFPVWIDGSLVGGEAVGLVYRERAPSTLVASLQDAVLSHDLRSAHVHLDGNWYLYRRQVSGTQYWGDRSALMRQNNPSMRMNSSLGFIVAEGPHALDTISRGRLIERER